MSSSQPDDFDPVLRGWECRETDHGVPYYINQNLKQSTWDHPYYSKIIEELDAYGDVHYAAYRTALKLRHLQKRLGLHLLSLQCLQIVLEEHGFPQGCKRHIDCQTLQLVLLDILHAADFRHFDTCHQDAVSELLLNFLLNLFDLKRSGLIPVVSVKLALAALCKDTLGEKYHYFFRELRTSQSFISKKCISTFIHNLIQIPDLLSESEAFGRDVSAAVKSCFNTAGSVCDNVEEDGFYTWLIREPQTLIWLPTLHRLIATETVKHNVKCGVCQVYPIVGFRYKCLQCFKYNICQDCFFHGKVSRSHHQRHPIQEFCTKASAADKTKAFLKIVRNKITHKNKFKTKVKYLPVVSTGNHDMLEREMISQSASSSSSSKLIEEEKIIIEPETHSDDSGNASDLGDGSSHQERAPPASPSPASIYDNSSSPARYIQERKPQKPSRSTLYERHSLIHLVHRLRRENRLLRQQLMGGAFTLHEDHEFWTSHATAEVTTESKVVAEINSCINSVTLGHTISSDTSQDTEKPSVLSCDISPITDLSTTDNPELYTSDFFSSILGTAHLTEAKQGYSTIGKAVLSSTPTDSHAITASCVPRSGPRKPPRLGDKLTLSPTKNDLETTFSLEDGEKRTAKAVFLSEGNHGLENSSIKEDNPEDENNTSPESLGNDNFNSTSKQTERRVHYADMKDAGSVESQSATTVQSVKMRIYCDRRWLRMSPGCQTLQSVRNSLPPEPVSSHQSTQLLNNLEFKTRSKSTGSLGVTHFSETLTPSIAPSRKKRVAWNLPDESDLESSRADSCLEAPKHAEIDAVIQWIDNAFPQNLTYSALSLCQTDTSLQGQMLRAAEDIGQAMVDLVQATADKCFL